MTLEQRPVREVGVAPDPGVQERVREHLAVVMAHRAGIPLDVAAHVRLGRVVVNEAAPVADLLRRQPVGPEADLLEGRDHRLLGPELRRVGRRRLLRDAIAGLALCAAVYVVFTHGLGVALPAGPWRP